MNSLKKLKRSNLKRQEKSEKDIIRIESRRKFRQKLIIYLKMRRNRTKVEKQERGALLERY